ncbi:MAG: ABC transporter substrate-binding protein [Oscillospiraceae bacterium]|jgi:polar amino acid transport system substrate-binding protein|nr:ABC transporter substrate-binding protein [Oscillospiraceae bacterium]
MKRFFRIGCALITAVCLLFSACGPKAPNKKDGLTLKAGVLTVGIQPEYPPMEYENASKGFDIDVATEAARRIGLQVEFVVTPWEDILVSLERGLFDCVFSAVSVTVERQKRFLFSKPYIANALCAVTKVGGPTVGNPAEFEGLRVGVLRAGTAHDILRTQAAQGFSVDIYPYDTLTDCYIGLDLNEIDAVYGGSVAASYFLKQDPALERNWVSEQPEPMAIAFPKDSDALVEQIDRAIDEMYYEGVMASLASAYFGEDFTAGLRNVTTPADENM